MSIKLAHHSCSCNGSLAHKLHMKNVPSFFPGCYCLRSFCNISQFIVNLSINALSSLMLCNFYPVFSLEAVVSSPAAKQQRQY